MQKRFICSMMDLVLYMFTTKYTSSESLGKGSREEIMLILTRRIGESVVIGDNIKLTVLGVKGSQVRIGIDAPKNVAVHREEIYDRIKGEGSEPEKADSGVE